MSCLRVSGFSRSSGAANTADDVEVDIAGAAVPLQKIETIDEPRSRAEAVGDQQTLFALNEQAQKLGDFRNQLIWGDNKLIIASLLRDFKGKVDLIYIDPPFDVGADFTMDVAVGDGDETIEKDQSTLELIAYRDMWGRGTDSYLHMMYERLVLMNELLSETGTIYVHVGWLVSHYVKAILDDVFGRQNFINQIIWKRQTAHSDTTQGAEHLGRLHDVILLYTKSERYVWNTQFSRYDEKYLETHYKNVEPQTGRRFELDNLTAPGGAGKGNPSYDFLGVKRFWRYSKQRMEELYKAGKIVQPSPGAVPRYKRYLGAC